MSKEESEFHQNFIIILEKDTGHTVASESIKFVLRVCSGQRIIKIKL